ncbi:BBE domain-containing protein [Sulfodiicoccus acidiphilus]|nr:BBE domain-containing protein [Sulfodiicoccus acidiphilus]
MSVGRYVNYDGDNSRESAVRSYSVPKYRRLIEVKKVYDPHDLFATRL